MLITFHVVSFHKRRSYRKSWQGPVTRKPTKRLWLHCVIRLRYFPAGSTYFVYVTVPVPQTKQANFSPLRLIAVRLNGSPVSQVVRSGDRRQPRRSRRRGKQYACTDDPATMTGVTTRGTVFSGTLVTSPKNFLMKINRFWWSPGVPRPLRQSIKAF